jgi:uncharacterized protein
MNCPLCNIQLVMSERQGIEIDYCPKCRGVWLDRGELDKIIERSLSELPRSSAKESGYDRNDHHEKYQDKHHYKKRNFLFDLFD